MDFNDIIWRLAQLGSLSYQERYVIAGSTSEYVLASELLENVDGLKYLMRQVENKKIITNDQMIALEDLFLYIERNSGEALSGNSSEEVTLLIRESAVWKCLRAKAANTLSLFNVEVDQMSLQDINSLTS